MDLKASPPISSQALSGRSVSCAIPPTDLIEQSKITTKGRCNGNGHATKEVGATAKKFKSLNHACTLEIELRDRRLGEKHLFGNSSLLFLGAFSRPCCGASGCSLPKQLLAAAATSCIQGDPKNGPSSAALKIVP